MCETPYLISVDCGTQSSRAIVWNAQGEILSKGRRKLEVLNPRPGYYEQDAESWWESTCTAIRKAVKTVDTGKIQALTITHQRETFVPVSEDLRPLGNALLHMDERCLEQVDEVKRKIGVETVQKRTGKIPSTVPSLYGILWLKEEKPEGFKEVYKFLDVQSYLLYHFTNKLVTSYVSADPTSLLNIKTKSWDKDLINKLGLNEEQFPELMAPGKQVGSVSKEASQQCDLPEGMTVISGAGDGICASLGTNTVTPGRAFLLLGSWSVLGSFSSSYVVDDAFRTLCNCVPDSYNLESNAPAGAVISWFVENFQSIKPDKFRVTPEEILEVAASKVPPGSDGLVTVPYWLSGVMAPYWEPEARGITLGWNNSLTKAHFYRSILEGIAFEHKLLLEQTSEVTDTEYTDLVLTAGGAKSALWGQIISDIIGLPLLKSRTIEATALGAAMLGAWGIDLYPSLQEASGKMSENNPAYKPRDEESEYYKEMYEKVYKPLFPSVKDVSIELNRIAEFGNKP